MHVYKVKIEKIHHRGSYRIAIKIPYQNEYIQKVKQIKGHRWSQTKKCWHIPYDNDSFRALKHAFGEVLEYPTTQASRTTATTSDNILTVNQTDEGLLKIVIPSTKETWLQIIKAIPGRKWHPEEQYWTLPNTTTTIRQLKHHLADHLAFKLPNPPFNSSTPTSTSSSGNKAELKQETITPQTEALNALEEQLLYERRAPSTVKAYLSCARKLFYYYSNIAPEDITDDQIKDYLIKAIKRRKISVSSQNQFLNAIKAFYKRVMHQDRELLELKRPKKPNQLPHVLSQKEVVKILSSVKNIKHKCILMLIYSAGLRVSEVTRLKIKDIDSNRMQIFIQGGKGKKDRYTLLSRKTLTLLRIYIKQYHPFEWLFEGISGGQYSTRSIQNLFQAAVRRARLHKRPTLHTLRHSFATHLLEKGINLRYIQALLGHESSRTTEIYTHVTRQNINQIESPLDGLDI